jgi:hypothetical protein
MRVGRRESGYADQVVGGGGEEEPGSVSLSAAVTELGAAGDGLDPPERLFDTGPEPLADAVPAVAGGAPVDCAAPVRRVLRDVGGDTEVAAVGDETAGVMALVGGHRAPPPAARQSLQHLIWASIRVRATVARSSGAAGDGLDVSPRDGLFELVALAVAGPLIGSRDQPRRGPNNEDPTVGLAPTTTAIWRDIACSVDGTGVRRITACV